MAKQKKSRLRRAGWIALGALLAGAALLAAFWLTLPDVAALRKSFPAETSLMRFRGDQARMSGRFERRHWRRVPLSRIAPSLVQAVLIAEDDKFFQHDGFDWESMRQAMEKNVEKGRVRRGGSTITQQLAKNLFLTPRQSIVRKLREAAIAWKLERELSKGRILELYLNVIEWGHGIYGAESAARHYFGVTAAALSVSQAIRLASVLPNPIRFRATGNDSARMNRKRQIVAWRMRHRAWIDEAQYRQAIAGFRAAD